MSDLWHIANVSLPWLSLGVGLIGLPFTLYLGALAVLGGRVRPPVRGEPKLRFAVVVPSHNESASIVGTVAGLRAMDYPDGLFEIVVVADNCSDDTAQLAETAGARVIERFHAELRGKGYALEMAFEQLLEEDVDGIVVVDADTEVAADLLRAFAARLEDGELACQAEYAVSNIDASWRTRLMTVALAMFHGVRSNARERLGLSSGLRGNGMCFSKEVLQRFPHEAYGLVEDVEYGIALGLGGVRVAYVGESCVRGEMVSTGKAAESQRKRWEGGRAQLIRRKVPPLLRRGFGGSATCMDLALDLLVPPLSYIGLLVFGALVVEGVSIYLAGAPRPSSYIVAASALGLTLYVLRGVQLSGLGMKAVFALAWAPVYVIWKIVVVRPWRADKTWVRTARETETTEAETERG